MRLNNAVTFAGYPVVEWSNKKEILQDDKPVAVAIRSGWDENDQKSAWVDKFNTLLVHPRVHEIPALVIGMWHYDQTVRYIVDTLVANSAKLTGLKALFVGDITPEENEISWIKQDDLSSLWEAFPNLEYLTIRGGTDLQLGQIKLHKLKVLRIETGGMSSEVVKSVGEADFPELESLTLWLGTANYGGTVKIADLEPFYTCAKMPKLTYLGLCDSEIADAIAEFMATAPVLERLDVLDMSLGTLTDEGALALLTSPYVHKLRKLDLHHHFCSDAMVNKLKELEQEGVQVDTSEVQRERDWRFVAVGE